MASSLKDKLPLIVGIGLPILLIVYIFITSYLPSIFLTPGYDFIYTSQISYNQQIRVTNGTVRVIQSDKDLTFQPTFYYYDVSEEKSTQITLRQAQTYTLDPSNKSPDGLTISQNENSANFFPLFWSNYDRSSYLKTNGSGKKLNLEVDSYEFNFVGWVLK